MQKPKWSARKSCKYLGEEGLQVFGGEKKKKKKANVAKSDAQNESI